jgi:hypothetical protein
MPVKMPVKVPVIADIDDTVDNMVDDISPTESSLLVHHHYKVAILLSVVTLSVPRYYLLCWSTIIQGGHSIVCGDTFSPTILSREVFAIAL